MKKIIYYVASSLDGYIAGPNDDISKFIFQGEGVKQYQKDLLGFSTVIMGRKTYEFGYQYGLTPGQGAYPHMEHHIFSDSLEIENLAETVHIEKMSIDRVQEIKAAAETDIYLCGGGEFAGWLLDNDMIDGVILKLNPVVLGGGVRLFGNSQTPASWSLTGTQSYEDGMQIISYDLA